MRLSATFMSPVRQRRGLAAPNSVTLYKVTLLHPLPWQATLAATIIVAVLSLVDLTALKHTFR